VQSTRTLKYTQACSIGVDRGIHGPDYQFRTVQLLPEGLRWLTNGSSQCSAHKILSSANLIPYNVFNSLTACNEMMKDNTIAVKEITLKAITCSSFELTQGSKRRND
jgi:hypothetical protein